MTIKKDHDEIWYWHLKIQEYKASGMRQKEYCTKYEIDYKRFCNMYYRMVYKSDTNPELYQKMIPITRKYIASGILASKFAKDNGVNIRMLSEMVTHLGYQDILHSIKKSKEEQPLQFIQVPTVQSALPSPPVEPEPEHEVLEKQNDIEIMITKGVKVSISPNIDSMKIIKIIELLKDL